ncbi:MAG: RNA polymerase-binding protein RbpA [Actinomycetes bacterium]
MSESMRGSRLGALSYETDAHVAPADRLVIAYLCPEGHETLVPFSVEAEEIPFDWSCRCGRSSTRPDAEMPEEKPTKHVRTHWDMLLERRTIADLEVLLQERLDLLHGLEGATKSRPALRKSA